MNLKINWHNFIKSTLWLVAFFASIIFIVCSMIFSEFGLLGFVYFLKQNPQFNESRLMLGIFIGGMIAPFAMTGLFLYAFCFSKPFIAKLNFSKLKKFLKRPGTKDNHDKEVV